MQPKKPHKGPRRVRYTRAMTALHAPGAPDLPSTPRHRLFRILHRPLPGTPYAACVSYVLTALIVINCIGVSLETVESIYRPYQHIFRAIEIASTLIFLVEYLCRLWVSVEQPGHAHPVTGRLRYMLQPLALLDLIVLLTFFAPVDVRFLRIFRITRLLRVLHLEQFNRSLHAIVHAIVRRRHLLGVAAAFMLTSVYFTAALIYWVEHPVQPDKFSSIPETLWWAVVTLTTIGYGDVFPITPLGKALTSIITLFGIGVFALPAAIITAAVLEAGQSDPVTCPHCQNVFER
jgi:voltage-gated potassium channel